MWKWHNPFKSVEKQAHTLQTEWCLCFSLEKFYCIKLPLKAEMTVVSLVERSLTADGDALLCNWDFKSTCRTRVTFQCLSPPAWQELMTANNAIFKASHLQPSKCEFSIAYIMWYDCVLFMHIIFWKYIFCLFWLAHILQPSILIYYSRDMLKWHSTHSYCHYCINAANNVGNLEI